ncbi:aminodeoxychorismate/anthranilate synthase component II [Botrimarina sp.]|uniref:anthranilate synthase component II n=1 Tax=Botrimarina sp. TaxID=2795802 RepID=UPI0032EAB205
MLLVIDNYDSFVHNLARLLRVAGAATEVVRNDAITADGVARLAPGGIVLSPGPGAPDAAGCCVDVVSRFAGRVPILGVCLGHQAIVRAFGGKVVESGAPMHGRTSRIEHNGQGLFSGAASPIVVCRYHSLVADPSSLPAGLVIDAVAEDGTIMAVRRRGWPVFGVQFHPEAILTEGGQRVLENFVTVTGRAGSPAR